MSQKLETIVNELSKRHKTFRLEDYLFPQQLAFVRDPSPYKVAVTSRRAGKTVSCAADLVNECLQVPDIACLYITLSRNNAKKLIWPEIKRICRKFKIEGEFNESELSVRFTNDSILYCSGASDRTEIEKFRGLALKKVYIDETQSFPAYIKDLIDEVIAPALMDYAGILCLIGTPGPIPAGFFYDVSRDREWAHHYWTFFDNPFITQKSGQPHDAILARELKRRGVSIDNPSIQREWFGKWVLDTDSLVYKYGPHNHFEEMPAHKWSYVLGIDIGYEDADAYAVLAWSETCPELYLVEEKVERHSDITGLVENINVLRQKYDISKILMDTAGLGKKIYEEITRRYLITISPAEKPRKLEFIELLNDALRTGKLKARQSSKFAQDCMKVEWDKDKSTPDKLVISDRYHSDICDSVLYAFRECYHYAYEKPKGEPVKGSPEWLEALEERALEHFKEQEELNQDPFYFK